MQIHTLEEFAALACSVLHPQLQQMYMYISEWLPMISIGYTESSATAATARVWRA